MPRKFSIDFGTTNSVIAQWNGEQRETIAAPGISLQVGEHFLIPSQLYVRDGRAGQIVIGAEVRANGLDSLHDNRLFRNFKRGIGANGTHEPRIIDGALWTDADAGQHFMRRLLQALPCPPNEIEQLVITAPVAAFAGYSAWLNTALDGFPAERVRIVDESTAAALGYAVTEPGANVLISDFGGGTLDLSLVRLPESLGRGGAAQVISKVGINLGGSDVDQWLLADMLERSGLNPQSLGLGFTPLLSAREHAKIVLSIADETTIEVQHQMLHITRAELESVLDKHGFFTALNQALDKLLGQAHQRGIFKEDVGHVLLVGGTSLIPSVQRSFDSYFRAVTQGRRKTSLPTWPATHWTVENTSIRVDKPFTAVVEGALQISAGLVLDDQLTYSYGLRVADSVTGQTRYEELIAAGSRYPSALVTVHLAASAPGQQIVHLTLGQIDASAAGAVEVHYDAGQVSFVSQPEQNSQKIVPLNAADPVVLQLDPSGERGKERLSASFHVDASRRLRLTVTDLKTHQKLFDGVIPLSPSAPTADGEKATGALAPALAAKGSSGGFKLSLRNLASALHLLPPSQVSDQAWAAALRSSDPLVRFNAAEVLGKRGDREARLVMEDVLANGAPAQRASAAQHIHRFSWFTAEGLFRRALQDDDPRVREGALFGLCKMRVPEAYRLALESLRDPAASDALRRAALWGTSSRPDVGSVPMLEEIITTGTPDIREQALEVLGATGATSGIAVARRAVDDADLTTKYAAVFSWVELAGETCFAEIATVIEKTQGEARDAILRGFFHGLNYIGTDASTHAAADQLAAAFALALTDPLPQTRISAARALAWLRRPAAEHALRVGFATETDSDVKAHMLRIAVHLSSPQAGKLLDIALTDSNPLVRQTAEYLKNHISV